MPGRRTPVTSVAVDTEKSRALVESLGSLFNPKSLIESFGLIGLWIIIFAETGLLIGLFFPGDSLIFLGGVAASPVAKDFLNVRLPIVALLIVTPIIAVAGSQLGYFLGHRYGRQHEPHGEGHYSDPVEPGRRRTRRGRHQRRQACSGAGCCQGGT